MRKVKNIVILTLSVVVLLLTIFSTEAFATVEYYIDGTPKKIVTDKGTILFDGNGGVSEIITPEGTAQYFLGELFEISGNPSISLEEAKAELNKLTTQTNNSNTVTGKMEEASLPNTGVENLYIFLIPF